jgi:hypothetical protein
MTEKNDRPTKFPEQLFVSHYDHSTESSPSLSVCLTEKEAIEAGPGGPTLVAMYRLFAVRKLDMQIVDVDKDGAVNRATGAP